MSSPLPPLPEQFTDRLAEILSAEDLESCLACFSSVRPTIFRINTLKGTEESTLAELKGAGFTLRPLSGMAGVHSVPDHQRRDLTESPLFQQGRIYIQNPSSMLPVDILQPQPGERVLDLAAAPGGKTLQMAARMQNRGSISAVEPVKGRFFKLMANLERHGATLVKCYLMDGRAVGSKVPAGFDRVLLDAPCSSEARFSRLEPKSWSHWSLKKIREVARKQKRLLDSAIRSLKPGGTLVYCTCAFSPEENELVVDSQLQRHPGLRLLPIDLELANRRPGLTRWGNRQLDPGLKRAMRLLPTREMDAFFIALLQKPSGSPTDSGS